MELLIFDVIGKFAHFRALDTTRENMTYPFPPRTAVMGMIGAILGIERNVYWDPGSPLYPAKIAIRLVNPIRRSRLSINYLQTKNNATNVNSVKILVPKDPFEVKSKDQRGFNMPVFLNVLRNVCFRIYVNLQDLDLFTELERRLEGHNYVYPPYLGHANMHAEIHYHGKFDFQALSAGPHAVDTIIPKGSLDLTANSLSSYGVTMLFNIPIRYKVSKAYIYLDKASDFIFNPNPGQPIVANFAEDQVWRGPAGGGDKLDHLVFIDE